MTYVGDLVIPARLRTGASTTGTTAAGDDVNYQNRSERNITEQYSTVHQPQSRFFLKITIQLQLEKTQVKSFISPDYSIFVGAGLQGKKLLPANDTSAYRKAIKEAMAYWRPLIGGAFIDISYSVCI